MSGKKAYTISMKPKISIITLGVKDYQRSLEFYRDGLGFPTEGNFEEITFFPLENIHFAIYPLEKLAEDATVHVKGEGSSGIHLGT